MNYLILFITLFEIVFGIFLIFVINRIIYKIVKFNNSLHVLSNIRKIFHNFNIALGVYNYKYQAEKNTAKENKFLINFDKILNYTLLSISIFGWLKKYNKNFSKKSNKIKRKYTML